MSQVEETQIMSQTVHRVKRLMKEALTRYDKSGAVMKKSSLWKDLQKLHSLLLDVKSYIGDCTTQNQIKLMEEIEEKVHLAADFMDEAALRALDGRSLSSSSQSPKTKGLDEKLEDISRSLQSLISKSEEYGLKKDVIPGADLSPSRPLEQQKPRFLASDKVEMIGRSEELKQLIDVLLEPGKDEESPLQIIPIVGEDGIGKTTLARSVYDHEKIKYHFDHRIWVCASASFEAKWVLENIREALAPNMGTELESVDEILAVLLKELDGKSFFLVLDDVSGTNEDLPKLKLLKDCLLNLNTTRRNKVVITTSSKEFAEEMGTTRRNEIVTTTSSKETAKEKDITRKQYAEEKDTHLKFHLQKLSDHDCKVILQNMSEDIQIYDIEQSIRFTGGVPLAAMVLGSTIKNMEVLQGMTERVINHEVHDELERKQENDAPTAAALELSYNYLPPVLQECFTYMSIFPPNTLIEKGNIIQLWTAHGFFQPKPPVEMEDEGEGCLNSLLSRCLIELAETDFYGRISSVRLSRHAWELASKKLNSIENYVSNHAGKQFNKVTSQDARLHTFFSVGNDVSYGGYKFSNLKVLNLSKSQFKKWPVSFEDLEHLRYIDVSGTNVTELPELITKLIFLQTIRAINCPNLKRLPKDLSKLEELRHFCIDADNEAIRIQARKGNMPTGIGTLTCLQTLPLVVVTKDPQISVDVLGPLKKLRGKLVACNLEHLTPKVAGEWNLMEKNGIDELIYEWSMNIPKNTTDNEVLEKLQPNEKLKSLTLQNFAGSEITMWKKVNSQVGKDTALLKYLMKLKLSNCYNCEKLPTLGTLPRLTELHLEGMDNLKSIGSEFYTDETKPNGTEVDEKCGEILFPVLKKFTMMYLAKLESWSEIADKKVFPMLEELRVEGCVELTSAPCLFQSLKTLHVEGIRSGEPLANICKNLKTLTSVFIGSVVELQSLPEEILRDNPNLASLHILNCQALTVIPNPESWGCHNSLKSLSINECQKLISLPLPGKLKEASSSTEASSLIELIISQCDSLKSISSLDGLCSLRRLKIEWCKSLECLPSGLNSCKSLEHLIIKGCSSLTSFQDKDSSKQSSVNEDWSNLTSLCSVNIQGCEKLNTLPLRELRHYLTKLKRLEIQGFTNDPVGLTVEYPGLKGWARFKALPAPLQTQEVKGAWTIDPKLLDIFATKAVGFLEAMQLFEKGVEAISQ